MLGSEQLVQSQAHQLLGDWLKAICHGTPQEVVEMYDTDGILIGTVAEEIKRGRPAIEGYFDMFMAKDKLCGKVTSMEVQALDNGGVVSVNYTFGWEEDGNPKEVNARYSYVFKVQPSGQIQIVNHHSSAQPESQQDVLSDISELF